jgi:hypothetical protein
VRAKKAEISMKGNEQEIRREESGTTINQEDGAAEAEQLFPVD